MWNLEQIAIKTYLVSLEPKFVPNNIIKVHENSRWAKKIMNFFIQGTLFQILCKHCVSDQQICRNHYIEMFRSEEELVDFASNI